MSAVLTMYLLVSGPAVALWPDDLPRTAAHPQANGQQQRALEQRALEQRALEQRLNIRIELADAAIRINLPSGAITASKVEHQQGEQRITKAPQKTPAEAPASAQSGLKSGSQSGPAPQPSTDAYLQCLVREFSVYPTSFVRRVQLQRIVVCEQLAFAGQRRAAVPDFAHNVLYLDWQRGHGNTDYQRAVMHHEFFHLVDYRDDGRVYEDSVWQQLNPAGFRYGSGGRTVQNDSTQSGFRQPTNGFVTHYATSGVEEDKAELFAHLLVNPEHVARWAARDAVLEQKVMQLKALLRTFSEDLNDDFWKQVTASAPQRRAAAQSFPP